MKNKVVITLDTDTYALIQKMLVLSDLKAIAVLLELNKKKERKIYGR